MRRAAACLPAVPFVLLPTFIGLMYQGASLPPDLAALASACGWSASLGLLAMLAAHRATGSGEASTVAVALAVGVWSMYPAVRQTLGAVVTTPGDPVFAAAYLAAGAWLAARAARSRPETLRHVYDAVRTLGIVMIPWMAGLVGYYYWYAPFRDLSRSNVGSTRPLVHPGTAVRPPDVYQIILDGFGRPDVLRAAYDLDLSAWVRALRARGFTVSPDIGMANYPQTYLSLASMLNGGYLDGLADRMQDSHSRWPLHQLIQHSAVLETFKTLGYQVHVIGSIYSATQRHRLADVCECEFVPFGEFESIVVHGTPIGDLSLAGWDYVPHRNKLERSLTSLELIGPSPVPRVVVAHIMAPHPPFVFDDQGRFVPHWRPFNFFDGNAFRGSFEEYRHGYRDQATYIARRVLQIVDRLTAIERDSGRQAVIIVHGDHGPRARFHTIDATRTDASESLPVLLAIRWPGDGEAPEVRSLVNVFRAVFRRYVDPQLPLLPDRAFVSSFVTPYRLIEVDPAKLEARPPGR